MTTTQEIIQEQIEAVGKVIDALESDAGPGYPGSLVFELYEVRTNLQKALHDLNTAVERTFAGVDTLDLNDVQAGMVDLLKTTGMNVVDLGVHDGEVPGYTRRPGIDPDVEFKHGGISAGTNGQDTPNFLTMAVGVFKDIDGSNY